MTAIIDCFLCKKFVPSLLTLEINIWNSRKCFIRIMKTFWIAVNFWIFYLTHHWIFRTRSVILVCHDSPESFVMDMYYWRISDGWGRIYIVCIWVFTTFPLIISREFHPGYYVDKMEHSHWELFRIWVNQKHFILFIHRWSIIVKFQKRVTVRFPLFINILRRLWNNI